MNDTTQPITSRLVPEASRMDTVDRLFGLSYSLQLEPAIFQYAEHLAAPRYNGGYWNFYTLSNGGFYLSLRSGITYNVSSANGFEGPMTGDALGIGACLYAYSSLSYGGGAFAELCANHYHWLREYLFMHPEARNILRAID